ncbi:MAG: IS1595 family transposase [Albidovulum sp.]|nr:IS1595 family transposase [Albidovulum sp.]
MEHSRIRHRIWAIAINLKATSLKGVSSMKVHRDHKITRKFAWFMAHRLREAFGGKDGMFAGPVEADESYFGGKRKCMSLYKRKELNNSERWPVGKKTVAGFKDRDTQKVRATVVTATDAPRVAGFVAAQKKVGATVTTDKAEVYNTLVPFFDRVRVNHSVPEYVRDMARANGNESFWTMLKRGYQSALNHVSPQNPYRFVNEITGRHNIRNADTIQQMQNKVAGIIGKRLVDKGLVGEKA